MVSSNKNHLLFPKDINFPRTVFSGWGRISELFSISNRFGQKGLIIHSRSFKAYGFLESALAQKEQGLEVHFWQYEGGEPGLSDLEALLDQTRDKKIDWLIAAGGGSVLDLGKACATLYNCSGPVEAYLQGQEIQATGVPCIAVPSTAGTGSEATKVSVLINEKTGVKNGFRSPHMLPQVVILDPELLTFCPARVIAHSGMDALTQAIESYISLGATWFTEQLALKGMHLISRGIIPMHHKSKDRKYAEDMLLGSFLIGIAFSASRLGVVHGLAHPLGARFNIPHGQVCAVCLPVAIEFNRKVVNEKYKDMSDAIGQDLLERIRFLLTELNIKNPFSGQKIKNQESLIREVVKSGSTKHNPREVTGGDVKMLLKEICA